MDSLVEQQELGTSLNLGNIFLLFSTCEKSIS